MNLTYRARLARGKELARLRHDLGLTGWQVAKAAGLSNASVCCAETGRSVSDRTFRKVEAALRRFAAREQQKKEEIVAA